MCILYIKYTKSLINDYNTQLKEKFMTQRINISIPDSLFEKLKNHKDCLNISKISQKAIAHAINLEEAKKTAIPDINELITRLKAEKAGYVKIYQDEGFKDGLKEAYQLSYDSFLFIRDYQDYEDIEIVFGNIASKKSTTKFEALIEGKYTIVDTSINGFQHEIDEAFAKGSYIFDVKGYPRYQYENEDFYQNKDVYLRGWLDGVLYVWNQAKDKI